MFSPQVTDPGLVRCDNVTGVACSADGRHLLGNYLNDCVYLFSMDGVGNGAVPDQALSSPTTGDRRARADVAADGAYHLLPLVALSQRCERLGPLQIVPGSDFGSNKPGILSAVWSAKGRVVCKWTSTLTVTNLKACFAWIFQDLGARGPQEQA